MRRKSYYQEKICEALGGEDAYDDQLKAGPVHKMYEEVTGKDRQPFKGRAWHIKQVNQQLGIETLKSYQHNSVRITQDVLKQWHTYLQQQ